MSATLFNLALYSVVAPIVQRGTIFNKSYQICAYADDIVIIARETRSLEDIYRKLESRAHSIGLQVNEDKTKYLIISNSNTKRIPRNTEIGKKIFEGVQAFRYLGTIINNDNSMRNIINERLQAGNRAFYANQNFFLSRMITRQTKLRIYRTIIRPVVTYGAEA